MKIGKKRGGRTSKTAMEMNIKEKRQEKKRKKRNGKGGGAKGKGKAGQSKRFFEWPNVGKRTKQILA